MNAPPVASSRRLAILGALWIFILVVVVFFRNVILPFAGAALIAYLVAPGVNRISQLKVKGRAVPRWAAILFIYALFFVVVYLAFIALVPQLYRELVRITQEAVEYANALTPERVQELSRRAEDWLYARGLPIELYAGAAQEHGRPEGGLSLSIDLQAVISDSATRVSSFLRENLRDIFAVSRRIIGGTLAAVFMLFFILMVAAYLSIDIKSVKAYARSLVPPELDADLRVLVNRIDRSLAGVVRGQVTICLVNGVLTFIGLVIFDVKFALLLATIATLLSLIPIFGSIISSIPIVAIGLSQSWQTGLAALLWIIGIHAVEAYMLNPKIMGSAARIHPLVVAFSLIAGERTFGLIGALFAVPIAAIVVACFDFARQKAQPPEAAAG